MRGLKIKQNQYSNANLFKVRVYLILSLLLSLKKVSFFAKTLGDPFSDLRASQNVTMS